MTTATHADPPGTEELDALLRLLDDETPEVRIRVAERFALCHGDLSEWLASRPTAISRNEKSLLSKMLEPARRASLARDWLAPTGGAAALQEDWESFEALLRTLSDFLHDGITLRQPLSDALDLLAEEAAEADVTSAKELREFLFAGNRLVANAENYNDPRNSDLAWVIAEGRSNPLGLSLVFLLTGRRMGFDVEGVNFPGHFLCRIFEDGYPLVIDCYDHGRIHLQSTLLESPELSRSQRQTLRQTAGPGSILHRLLNNLHGGLEEQARDEDALLVLELQATLM